MGYATRRQCSAVQPPSHHVGNKATDIIAGQYQQDTFNLNVQNTGQQIQISWILICFASSPSGVVVTRAEKNIEALFNLCNCLLNIFPFKKRNKNHLHNPYVHFTTKVIKVESESKYFFPWYESVLKYGSEEKDSSFCKCSILLGFIMWKTREVAFWTFIRR